MASPAKIEPSAALAALSTMVGQEFRSDHSAAGLVTTREEAEFLLMLDHSGARTGPEWRAFLVKALVEFLAFRDGAGNEMREPDLDWLLGLVADAPSPSLPALLFALACTVEDAPERLIALTLKHGQDRTL